MTLLSKKIAQMWLNNLSQPELQEEVCRLASEENNQEALTLATECGYTPSEPSQAALFCYFTQQWDKYREIDPDYQLLENFYYNATSELQERIEKHGITFKRLEWIWIVLGGKKRQTIKRNYQKSMGKYHSNNGDGATLEFVAIICSHRSRRF